MNVQAFLVQNLVLATFVEAATFSAFRNSRIPKDNLKYMNAFDSLCACVKTCRIFSVCYGVTYGALYKTSSEGIQMGTPGICHITSEPLVPGNLEPSLDYTTVIVGRIDSGCEDVYGFNNLGSAGCIMLATEAKKRTDAINACKDIGGTLAVLPILEQYNEVVKALKRIDLKPGHYWVYASASVSWSWKSGQAVDSALWGSGEPTTGSFAVMNSDLDFNLSSTTDASHRYVCQKAVDFP